ncbi:ArsR/SmtB family transcription factor [Salinisphaera orenii]|uniref:ArsR/SmtB family transcription factor n=1 Tax=Salinisphaera orenii TaxID=856731 RepID=UPI000DBE23E9
MDEICRQDCVHAGAVAAARERIAEDERRAPDAASWFKTLGNPQRLTILRALRHGELCVCDIAVLLGLSTGVNFRKRLHGRFSSRLHQPSRACANGR